MSVTKSLQQCGFTGWKNAANVYIIVFDVADLENKKALRGFVRIPQGFVFQKIRAIRVLL
jgi:hypothetical protein